VSLSQILTIFLSHDRTLPDSWYATVRIGKPYWWSLVTSGWLDRRSYKSTWPDDEPAANCRPSNGLNCATVTSGSDVTLANSMATTEGGIRASETERFLR